MNIAKLIATGRVNPIIETDSANKTWLKGYQRRPGRKGHQRFFLKVPKLLRNADGTLASCDASADQQNAQKQAAV